MTGGEPAETRVHNSVVEERSSPDALQGCGEEIRLLHNLRPQCIYGAKNSARYN
jgi:hypothetical protein